MSGPFRTKDDAVEFSCESEFGTTRLQGDDSAIRITNRRTDLHISRGTIKLTTHPLRRIYGLRRDKTQTLSLRADELFYCRSWPSAAFSLWRGCSDARVERVWGLSASHLFKEGGVSKLRDFERLSHHLQARLQTLGYGATCGTEFGEGHHRVLVLEHGPAMCIYSRPVFRESPRLQMVFMGSGDIRWPGQRLFDRKRQATIEERFEVVLTGDRIRFVNREGDDVGALFLPWISDEDRAEIATRMQRRVDEVNPRPRFDSRRITTLTDCFVVQEPS